MPLSTVFGRAMLQRANWTATSAAAMAASAHGTAISSGCAAPMYRFSQRVRSA